MPEDPFVLARACPAGLWLPAAVLTVLAIMGNPLSGLGQALAEAFARGLVLMFGKLAGMAVEAGSACACVGLFVVVALFASFVFLIVLMWRSED